MSDFVTKTQIGDPDDARLKLFVNGEVKQDANTEGLLFKMPELIEYLSKYMTLNEGDLLFTGTPAGAGPVKVGDHLQAFLQKGDGTQLAGLEFKVEPKN